MSISTSNPQSNANNKWRHVSEIRNETLDYIIKRQQGLIKSLKTPWNKLNISILDGLEWGSVMVIAGRPGSGKTTLCSQITNTAHLENPTQDFAVLNFQFEMTDRSIGARELTGAFNTTMNHLFSTDPSKPLTLTHIEKIKDLYNKKKNDDIYFVTDPITARDIRSEVIKFYNTVKKPIIVTIDHSVLVKKHTDEKDQLEALYALSTELVYLKKKIPDSIYIILSQMNRTIEDPKRKEDGKIGNYPTSNDLFAADALMQNADVVIAINRPDILGIREYGPEQIKVVDGMVVLHLIKNRYGEQSMLFFEEDLKHFRLNEGPKPLMKSQKK